MLFYRSLKTNVNCMQANAEKFQLILFCRNEAAGSLNVGGTAINSEPVVKLMGVYIHRALSFSDHITLLCKKAGKYINVLSRLSNELTTEAKLLLFRSFILSHFNYCCLIWHFCGLGDLIKMEKVQLRALRIVFNDFHASYSDLRSRAGRLLLYTEHQKAILTEVFRRYLNVSPEYNRCILLKHSTPYNIKNMKSLEMQTWEKYLSL